MPGTLERHANFPSQHVPPRHIDVWRPSGDQGRDDTQRTPVLYMHDGQNLFDFETASIGVDWGIDEALSRLITDGTLPPTLVVGVWNTSRRAREYLPARPFASLADRAKLQKLDAPYRDGPLSDAYLRFLVEELKPFIDRRYPTHPDRAHTFIMGSSMGGLISLYALCEYPDIFGGAACLSTHWPAVADVIVPYLKTALPRAGRHRLYFDYGTRTLDAGYAPYQAQVDQIMRAGGYKTGQDWVTRRYTGAEHSERAWRERAHVPLKFLLGKQPA